MTRRSWIQFFALAALWGASYLFIKVALEDISPAMIVFARTALASLVLLPFALHRGALDALRGRPGTVAILALLQVAAPFFLITVGEQDLPSSLTGILVATVPIFSFLLAIRLEREARAQGPAIFGVALGIGGVALLLGIDAGGGSAALIGGGMVVLASLGYALGAFYLRRNLSDAQPVGVVAGAMGASALMMAPLAALSLPSEMPGLDTFGSLFVLGVGGTGIAFLLFYTLIAEVGPTRSSLVAYVAPGFSVIYGVVLLDEPFSAATFAGLVLILGGSWLAAEGRLPWQSKRAVRVPAAPTPEVVR